MNAGRTFDTWRMVAVYPEHRAWELAVPGGVAWESAYNRLPLDIGRGLRRRLIGHLCWRPWGSWECTRAPWHTGRHHHADGTRVLAVWP